MSERMWAPWRMEYILNAQSRPSPGRQGACIFCDFASTPPSTYRDKLVLLVQERALVVMNRYPFAASHVLVAPRRHVGDLAELDDAEYDAVMRLLRETIARVRKATNAQGLDVGFNLGKAAGAGIAEHVHGHVVPRWVGDVNFMPVIADVRAMPEYLEDSWKRLLPFFADLPGQHAEGV